MKMLNAPVGAWLCGSMFPTWSGYRKGATALQIQAKINAIVVPGSGFGLVQHCIRLGSRALTLPRKNDSDRPLQPTVYRLIAISRSFGCLNSSAPFGDGS
jgi:hypothetical protein